MAKLRKRIKDIVATSLPLLFAHHSCPPPDNVVLHFIHKFSDIINGLLDLLLLPPVGYYLNGEKCVHNVSGPDTIVFAQYKAY